MLNIPYLLSLFLFLTKPGFAHPISLSTAKVKVGKQKLSFALTIMYEDYVLYQHARADERGRLTRAVLERAIPMHGKTLLAAIHLHDHSGKRLVGRIEKVEPMPLPVEGLHFSTLMSKTVTYHLAYKVSRPQLITFFQLFPGGGALPALMDLNLEQEGVSTQLPARLSNGGNPLTLAFSWPDAAKAAAPSPRKIPAEAPQARIEVVDTTLQLSLALPLAILESWIKIPRKDADRLQAQERRAALPLIADFMREALQVRINGKELASQKSAIALEAIEPIEAAKGAQSAFITMAKLTLQYLRAKSGDQISVKYTRFNQSLYELLCQVNKERRFFTTYKPEITFVL